MKTRIIAAGHKIISERIRITSFYDEIEWSTLEEKDKEMIAHVDLLEKLIEDNKLEFHSESLTFIDYEG